MREALILITGYFLGSANFAIIFSTLFFGNDVRKDGSGNAGATNMARSYGMLAGILTLVGDVLKTVLALWIGKELFGNTGILFAGVGCLFGHCFPLFYRFEGGKAVAVGTAVYFSCSWRIGLVSFAVFFLVAFISRKVSLASLLGAVAGVAAAMLFKADPQRLSLVILTCFVVFVMHGDNIKRLIKGEEPNFSLKKRRLKEEEKEERPVI